MTQFQIGPGELPAGTPTMWLRLPKYTDSLCHGQYEYIVNNWTGQVEVRSRREGWCSRDVHGQAPYQLGEALARLARGAMMCTFFNLLEKDLVGL